MKPVSLLLLLCLCLSACKSSSLRVDKSLPDGIYLLLRTGETKAEVAPLKTGEALIRYTHKYAEGESMNFMVVSPAEFVALRLKESPEKIPQEDGRSQLWVSLQDSQARQLQEFSTRHLNQKVAMVINGEGVTQHVIRTVLDQGKVQITRCHDNACEKLYYELEDNVGN